MQFLVKQPICKNEWGTILWEVDGELQGARDQVFTTTMNGARD